MRKNLTILGVETSCDETAAAVVRDGKEILSNVVASSEELHKRTGGIVPEVAAREQIKCIIPVIREALEAACGSHGLDKIDAIAVTQSPGLIGSLIVGVETAKTLSVVWQKPLVPVNHLLAHIYANWLEEKEEPSFPAMVLVVSGGHTELVLMAGHGSFRWIGGTRDDAAGEAFDKAAKMLNLGYPGGPIIEKTAQSGNPGAFTLPRPMIKEENWEFSFSGLKTALYYLLKEQPALLSDDQTVKDLAASFQQAVVEVLVHKTLLAAEEYHASSIVLAGGVSANNFLRAFLEKESEVPVFVPDVELATDNAAVVASCAYYNYQPQEEVSITADPSFDPHALNQD